MPVRVDDGWSRLADVVLAMQPAELAALERRLPPEDVARIRRVLDTYTERGWRSNPAAMAHHLTGGEYRLWRHTRLLSRQFAGAFTGDADPHQIWNLPSQYGKTTLLGVWGPVWALDRDPSLRIMFVSYDADKAVNEAGLARDLAERHADRLRFRLRRDQRARGLWRTDQGGGLYATGIRGAITGFPADVLLLDDLLKGWQAAHSAAERDFVWNVWRSQLRMRVQANTSPIIVSGTRWHEDDYFARLEKAAASNPAADQWEVTRLAAIAEGDADPLGRSPGEALEPERFPVEEVLARRATLGSYLWTAMEQQRPAPEEGGELQRSWWRWSSAFPDRFDDTATSWDMKLKDKEAGDYVVGQAWGRSGSTFWLRDQVRGQWSMAAARVAVVLLAVRHPDTRRHFIENAGYGPEVMDLLREADPDYMLSDQMADLLGVTATERPEVQAQIRRGLTGIVPVKPVGPKTVRVRAVSGKIEAGNVMLPEGRDFAHSLVDEAAAFPNGAHDDQVDAMSQALSRMAKTQGTIAVAKGSVARPRPNVRPDRPGRR